jgi:hypothetical protein
MSADVRLTTLSMPERLARTVNATGSFPSKVPTVTEPFGDAATATGASVIDLASRPEGMFTQNGMLVVAFGTGANDTTFSFRVIGWNRIGINTIGQQALWVPVNLLEIACIIGTPVGVAGTLVPATCGFVDTMTVTTGSTLGGETASENIVSPANDTIACCLMDLKGFKKVEITFNIGTATDANALVTFL